MATTRRIPVLCITEGASPSSFHTARVLRRDGFDTSEALAEGFRWDCATGCEPSLIVFDLVQLDGCGYQVCKQIRILTHLPILVILHGSARTDVMRVFAAGADMYMLAPFDEAEFLARVQVLLRRLPSTYAAAAKRKKSVRCS